MRMRKPRPPTISVASEKIPRPSLIGSVLGRRMLAQYVGAALLPIATLAVLVYLHVSDGLQQARDAQLVQAARSYGAALQDRLLVLDSALREVAALPSPSPALEAALSSRVGKEFDAVTRLGPGVQRADPAATGGTPVQLDAALRDELARGKTALRLTDEASPRVVLLRKAAGAEPAVVAATVAPAYLAGDPDAVPKMTGICVMSAGQVVSGCQKRVTAGASACSCASAPAVTRFWQPLTTWPADITQIPVILGTASGSPAR